MTIKNIAFRFKKNSRQPLQWWLLTTLSQVRNSPTAKRFIGVTTVRNAIDLSWLIGNYIYTSCDQFRDKYISIPDS